MLRSMTRLLSLSVLCLVLLAPSLSAHEVRPAYLELTQTGGGLSARGLVEAPLGRWAGPLESSYGLHLVLVREQVPGRTPDLAKV